MRSLLITGIVLGVSAIALAAPKKEPKLDPTRAYIEIKCNIADAEVVIDNKPSGQTPIVELIPVESGQHTIKIRKKGYSEFAEVVKTYQGKVATVKVELLAVAGYLKVNTQDKEKAQVYLDGKFLGETPFEGEIPIGPHELEVRRLGFYDYRTQFSSVGGEQYPYEAPLQKLPADLDPREKKAPIDTIPFRKTPAGIATIAGGVGSGAVLIPLGFLLGRKSIQNCGDLACSPDVAATLP